MKLYHGSNVLITQIDLSIGRDDVDFGRGFYLTSDYAQALNRAKNIVAIKGGIG
ncbi:MAG: DUF3990 domain-containing protein, partial [Bifidobacteriaceae bacterium]|nr:DUF3990 domain-containing protein [Bifidobacteriaceae bacterium]